MPSLRRAKSITEIYNRKRKVLPFKTKWKDHIGCPEVGCGWIIYGHSGHGKTSYATQLAHYLTQFGPVWYNGLEEGDAQSFENALKRVGMETVKRRFLLIEDYTAEELRIRLQRRNKPMFVIIDSLQKFDFNMEQYNALERDFPNTSFIYISHAEGKRPEGRKAKKVEYYAFVKVFVEGFRATAKSRFGGIEPYVIFPKRAAEYWQKIK